MILPFLFKILIHSLAVFFSARLLAGVELKGTRNIIATALLLSLVNTFLRPILAFLSFPITVVTLGLFSFVIDGILVLIVSALYPHFKVKNLFWAILFSLMLSMTNALLFWMFS